MSVYVVIPTGENRNNASALIKSTFGEEGKDWITIPDNGSFLVYFKGSTPEFEKKLNLQGNYQDEATDHRPCTAIYFQLTVYGGFASKFIWDWVFSKLNNGVQSNVSGQ